MKTLFILTITSLILCTTTHAQDDGRAYIELVRNILDMEKKAAVIEVMEFTESESVPFWELYGEYSLELYKIHNKRLSVIKDFAENFNSMTNEKANEIWLAAYSYKKGLLKLQKQYYPKFKKILPVTKAVRYLQFESKIDALINAELAYGIPLLDSK